ncbi:threonine--tRNA ligase, partial [Candidatus Micrarchaeota archaeon CG06_land_8_20_14_3_00_50_6]
MKILSVHSDYIVINPISKAIKNADESDTKETKTDECLVIFTAVEQRDEQSKPEEIASAFKKEIDSISEQVKCKRVVVYPLVHLTSKPSEPIFAQKVLAKIMETLEGYEVHKAPFGWYKGYTLKCKGHPLSELSREIVVGAGTGKGEENVSRSIIEETKVVSKFYILDMDGSMTPAENYNFEGNKKLETLYNYEHKKQRVYAKEPPHIKIMKEHSLVDYEPASDSGNFRWYPNGRLVKKLMERYVTDVYINYGAMEVETPIMYDYEHPALKKYLNRFPARQYTVKSDVKEFFLRFSACFGQFLIMHDMTITYRHLPLKIYELTRYSFRREQSGELAGLKRLRAFTMPDMHTVVADYEAGRNEFEAQLKESMNVMDAFTIETEVAFRALEEFYNVNKEWYIHLVKDVVKKPILIEIFDRRYAYFITKFEFNYIDTMEKASALSTVQIDVENSETFDISYVGRDGQKKRPHILHASLSGSLERVVYALLETEALKAAQGKMPMLP